MNRYIHERPDWPNFHLDEARLSRQLASVRHAQGKLLGQMEALGFHLRAEATLANLTDEIIKSNEIEGEQLDRDQVRSSLARRLGVDIGALTPADRSVEGVVEMVLDATTDYKLPITKDRLFGWHAALFPIGYSGIGKIVVGSWRNDSTGPMRVVSGPIGRERVHFEAPIAAKIDAEMNAFLSWFNAESNLDFVLKAGIAHLWFVTIHPFQDGNGRIARALTDLMLARSEKTAQRFYSMSAQIREEREEYYRLLEATQKGTLEVTQWIEWFLACLGRAFAGAETVLASVKAKVRVWERIDATRLNDRQRRMINKLLDGFFGKLTTSKWAQITKCSADTALRDIETLIGLGILRKDEAGGRSTSYTLVQ